MRSALVVAHSFTLCSLCQILRCAFLSFLLLADFATAQVFFRGQVFTNGLAIVDAPAPRSQLIAGSTLDLAIDVSGDGQLPSAAATPGSGLATGFNSLNVFLISYDTPLNITISIGPGLLTQEPGSTIKNLEWPIPSCVPPGQYNLTLYETSHIVDLPFFSITPITIYINNPNPAAPCPATNPLQPFPQSSSPPPQNPFLPSTTVTVTGPTTTTTIVYTSQETIVSSVTPLTTVTATSPSSTSPTENTSGFVPVNGAPANMRLSFSLAWTMSVVTYLVLHVI